MQKSRCPECSSELIIDDEIVEGDLVTCNNCQCDLDVITLHPITLEIIPEE